MRIVNLLFLMSSVLSGVLPASDPSEEVPSGACLVDGVSDPLAGTWEGHIGEPPRTVVFGLAFREEGGEWSGTFSVPADGIQDVPIHAIQWDGEALVAHLTPQRRFEGGLAADSLVGRLVFDDQGGREMALALHREGTEGWDRLQDEFGRQQEEREAAPPPGLVEAERGGAWSRVDPAALARLVEAAEGSRSSALVVLRDGELVGRWYDPGGARRIEAMSVTKSVLSLAVGRLLALGHLESLDVPVHRFFPEWGEGPHSRITVRHLLNHTSGLESPMPANPIYASDDFVAYALESELASDPGAEVRYNNNATNLLAGVIGRAAGDRMDRFIGQELFGPLGITDFTWSLDPAGNPHGMAGLQIHAHDLARLGQLVLQDGVWEGHRLLPGDWIEKSLRPGSELAGSVGLLWWLVRDGDRIVGARADGYLGQYLVIYPESGLVGVRMIEYFDGWDEGRDGLPTFQDLIRDLK
jgi:CubicO group peptidase (beta-lactamase class C family)